jgi:PAS domain S-box-containing protein
MNSQESLRDFCKNEEAFQNLLQLMQQNISDSAMNFEAIFQLSPDSILIIRQSDGLILRANQATLKIGGYQLEDIVSKIASNIWGNPDNIMRVQRALMRYGRVDNLELPVPREDGSMRAVMMSAVPIRYNDEDCLMTITRDLSSIIATHERLQAVEARYEAVVETQSELICRYSPDTTVVFANEAYHKYMGKTHDEVVGQSFLKFLDETQVEFAHAHIQRLLSEKQRITHEMRIQQGAMQGHWIQWLDTPILNQDGEVIEIQAVGRDISERKLAEEKEFELAVERQRSEILSQFVRNAAHEFYTPLSTIETTLHLIQNSSDEDRRQRAYEKIRAQTQRIASLVDGMTTMMRLSNTNTGTRTPIDFPLLFDLLLDSLHNALESKRLHVDCTIASNLPQYFGVINDLRGALRHVLDNAIRHSPDEGLISIHVQALERAILITVHNQGESIPEADLSRIFEMFFRRDTARTTPGLGLGLSIARAIIEQQHGGHISAESGEDGTSIQIRLPLYEQ